ncbi:thioesterase II family protein [Phytomonospora endophytica]|uniref:Surfactin synthase thioesterase subunit n=1 Tax=Phytomonospora endophytica TaxID=714109 RepID=A0A841FPY4_9ACTN|nr:alpha/beta fold hydrolase [Phytomonospora endophytica]MBB6038185.1 surfactin synthase thioesterase subunit [Phytomonospora endophytica]GIG67354.1 thioesterase [Phytomonospora endophytica]
MTGAVWELVRRAAPGPATRLHCFPHSGGSPGEYLRWSDALPRAEVRAVQLPGHGARLAEAPLRDVRELVGRLVAAVEFTPPFVLFGHSLGALIAYETAHALSAAGLPPPAGLVVSAYPAPHLTRLQARTPVHRMSDGELTPLVLAGYGELADELRADPEYLGMVLDRYRADHELVETYQYREREPLTCDVTVLGGLDDDIGVDELAAWRAHTDAGFAVHLLPGDHFYIRSGHGEVMRLLDASLFTHRPQGIGS